MLVGDLRVELHAHAATDAEQLGAVVVDGEQLRFWRRSEAVVMPLEPDPATRRVVALGCGSASAAVLGARLRPGTVGRSDLVPADLRRRGGLHRPTERLR